MNWRQIPHRKVYVVFVIKDVISPAKAISPLKPKKVEKVANPFAVTKLKKQREASSNGKSLLNAIAKTAKVEGTSLILIPEKVSISKKSEMKRKNQTSILQFSKKRDKKQIQFLEVDKDEIMQATVIDSVETTNMDELEKENEGDSLPANETSV
jgi:hypothetical protein